ncbi:Uncharacterized protein cpbgf_6003480 [Cryptosporidium parvum]|nr:Uncharacterized protein CPATCC_0015050 [Cryptosporidium parvum]WRK32953.1 Uncharacterized protein cpbgf_6003480 [Cryptosporidium parvum]|eukprot:QOY41233.1 hypothetical protein CPATCC_002905 [Cryptosporidium parvum]
MLLLIVNTIQYILFEIVFAITFIFSFIKKVLGFENIEDQANLEKVKKVPKHMVIVFRGSEVIENGVLYLLYKACRIFKQLGVEYVTIFEPNGIVESKLTVLLNNEDEIPANLRFLSSGDSSKDFLNKIQRIVEQKHNSNEKEVTYREIYSILNSGGNWPKADCILILRNMPFDIPINGFNSLFVILNRLREYTASFCTRLFIVTSLGTWGEIPPLLAQHAEIYELWGFNIRNIEKSIVLYSHSKQRHGK